MVERGKRLRYSLAFAESLLPASRLHSYRKQLSLVQDVLGENGVEGIIAVNNVTGEEWKLDVTGLFVDIGHKPPQMSLVQGALAELEWSSTGARLEQTLG